jgi:hypothetical protein
MTWGDILINMGFQVAKQTQMENECITNHKEQKGDR